MELNEDKFITVGEATKILGYKSYLSLNRIIKEGFLTEYKVPLSNRPKFKLSEVMDVATPVPPFVLKAN